MGLKLPSLVSGMLSGFGIGERPPAHVNLDELLGNVQLGKLHARRGWQLKKRRKKIAKMSRKVNYQRNGTRG